MHLTRVGFSALCGIFKSTTPYTPTGIIVILREWPTEVDDVASTPQWECIVPLGSRSPWVGGGSL